MLSPDSEVDLYVEIILNSAAEDSNIYIKGHPRDSKSVVEIVADKLKGKFKNIIYEYGDLEKYPIELWINYLPSCKVISIYSTSAINLSYLYGKDIEFPLTNALINKYFYPHKVDYIIKGNIVTKEATMNLDEWNGVEPLWSAKKK